MKKLQKPILDKEAMIKWLGEIIDAEMEKGDDEIDMALVMECDAYLAELMSDVVISEEQMAKNIASIKGKTCNDKITSTKRRTPRMRRIIAAVCAASTTPPISSSKVAELPRRISLLTYESSSLMEKSSSVSFRRIFVIPE